MVRNAPTATVKVAATKTATVPPLYDPHILAQGFHGAGDRLPPFVLEAQARLKAFVFGRFQRHGPSCGYGRVVMASAPEEKTPGPL